jgi:hypothetical protein
MIDWILTSGLIIAALVVIGLLLLLIVFKKKKEGKIGEPNYRVFFNIGMIWIPVGVVFMITINIVIGIAFMCLGTSYMAIGLANRNKWEKKK